jgi:hypothetical protein
LKLNSGLVADLCATSPAIKGIQHKLGFAHVAPDLSGLIMSTRKEKSDEESIFHAARIDRMRLAGYMSPRQSERGCSYARPEIQQ